MNELKIAVEAALSAGQSIMDIYESGDWDVTAKIDQSPLTRADTTSHEVIMSFLETTGIPVLSEEGKTRPFEERAPWKELWIVDPIDGTKEFIKRNGEFTVNIAFVREGLPVMGVIFVPVLGELYFASSELGAYKTTDVGTDWDFERCEREAIKLPVLMADRPYTVVASRSHMSPETEAYIDELRVIHGEVNLISKGSSLKLCMVAEGQADCYPRFAPTMEWDTAAGQAICMCAGLRVIDWNTKEDLKYNRSDLLNPWFLVYDPKNRTS